MTVRRCDVAIVGGGPAGLAIAIEAAQRGLETVVVERRPGADKACGEGLVPRGVAHLARLGVLERLAPSERAPLSGVRFHREDGLCVRSLWPQEGLGIERVSLLRALWAAAFEAGARLMEGRASAVHAEADGVHLDVDGDLLRSRVLVVADGLNSPLRHALGLDGGRGPLRRFGVRAHLVGLACSGFVDVHFTDGLEAYVTPLGPARMGVAFLWDGERLRDAGFERLLARFPLLERRLAGATRIDDAIGAGPFDQRSRAVVQGRVVLAGDAAGYVDAITGEGLTLAFDGAAVLGPLLRDAVGGHPESLARYAEAHERAFRAYARKARALLWVTRRPAVRDALIVAGRSMPGLFSRVMALASVPETIAGMPSGGLPSRMEGRSFFARPPWLPSRGWFVSAARFVAGSIARAAPPRYSGPFTIGATPCPRPRKRSLPRRRSSARGIRPRRRSS